MRSSWGPVLVTAIVTTLVCLLWLDGAESSQRSRARQAGCSGVTVQVIAAASLTEESATRFAGDLRALADSMGFSYLYASDTFNNEVAVHDPGNLMSPMDAEVWQKLSEPSRPALSVSTAAGGDAVDLVRERHPGALVLPAHDPRVSIADDYPYVYVSSAVVPHGSGIYFFAGAASHGAEIGDVFERHCVTIVHEAVRDADAPLAAGPAGLLGLYSTTVILGWLAVCLVWAARQRPRIHASHIVGLSAVRIHAATTARLFVLCGLGVISGGAVALTIVTFLRPAMLLSSGWPPLLTGIGLTAAASAAVAVAVPFPVVRKVIHDVRR